MKMLLTHCMAIVLPHASEADIGKGKPCNTTNTRYLKEKRGRFIWSMKRPYTINSLNSLDILFRLSRSCSLDHPYLEIPTHGHPRQAVILVGAKSPILVSDKEIESPFQYNTILDSPGKRRSDKGIEWIGLHIGEQLGS